MCHSSHRPWQLLYTSLAVQPGSGHQRRNLMTTNSTFKMISKGRYAMSTLGAAGLLAGFALLGSVATSRAEIIHYCPPPTHYVVGSGCISWLGNPATRAYVYPRSRNLPHHRVHHAVRHGPNLQGNNPVR